MWGLLLIRKMGEISNEIWVIGYEKYHIILFVSKSHIVIVKGREKWWFSIFFKNYSIKNS